MIIRLSDFDKRPDFCPLTLTRPIGNLRMGLMTNDERWKFLLPESQIVWGSELTEISGRFTDGNADIEVNACVVPNESIAKAVADLAEGNRLMIGDVLIASRGENPIQFEGEAPVVLNHRWELYQKNGEVLKNDFELVTKGRTSQKLSNTNTVLGDSNLIFLEEGAKVEGAILNTQSGPIYLGRNAEIMEGCLVRGGLAMAENSILKLGAKVYGPTSLGPYCKVGGEINNCIFYGYSNKGHDGFLGNSLVGEWCNLGADTNTSNLKNNYGRVKTYSYRTKSQEKTDVQFMGLTMGDHSKCGINTMFNTATVVGVSCNVFGGDFPDKYIRSFQWGLDGDRFDFDKAVESANNMMVRRGKELSDDEITILRHIADNE